MRWAAARLHAGPAQVRRRSACWWCRRRSIACGSRPELSGLDKIFLDFGAEWPQRGLLDVPRHEPRPARPRGAVGVDVRTGVPRGAPGQGQAGPTWCPAARGRRPPSADAVRPTPTSTRASPMPDGSPSWTSRRPDQAAPNAPSPRPEVKAAHGSSASTPASGSRCAAATSTLTRSSRPSTSSGSRAPGPRTRCSPPGAATRRSCSTRSAYHVRLRARRGPRLRHRLVPRARGVGAQGLRLQGRLASPVRGHLPRQLAASRAWWPRRRPRRTSVLSGRSSRRARASR